MASSKRPTRRTLVVYLLGLCLLLLARPAPVPMLAALPVAVLGLVWRLWATGYLTKNQSLCRAGPYRRHRHPLYFGTWLISSACVLAAARPAAGGAWVRGA